ncbi:hypothetical protein MBLNU457_6755t1 [Dothideomycetes sp. NU457]
MESSPPMSFARDMDGPQSEYELDLNALSLGDSGDFSSPLPTKHIDHVRSEDIDGPSDFTINMEKWMRGTPQKDNKSPSRFGTINRSVLGSVRNVASLKEPGNDNAERTDHARKHDSGYEMESNEDNVAEAGANDQENTPTAESSTATVVHDGAETSRHNEDQSMWDPYEASASPLPLKKNGLLQPTVEDYHSELSPARVVSIATTRQAQPAAAAQPAASLAQLNGGRTSPTPAINTAPTIHTEEQNLFTLRAQFEELRKLQEETSRKAEALRNQLQEATEARSAIDTELNAVKLKAQSESHEAAEKASQSEAEIKHEREEAEKARKAQNSAVERIADLQAHINHLEDSEDEEFQNLQSQVETLKQTESDQNRTIAELRGQLTKSDEGNTQLQQDLESSNTTRDALESRLQSLQQEMNNLKQQYETEISNLRQTLENERKQASSTNPASTETANLQAQLTAKTAALEKAETELSNLREELDLQATFTRLDASDDETLHKHGRETSSATSSYSSETADLRAQLEGAHQALDAAESRFTEQEELVNELRAQRDMLKSSHMSTAAAPAPAPSRTSPVAADKSAAEDLAALKEETATLRASLSATRAELHDSEHKRLDLHQRVDGLVAELADVRAVNAALDVQITQRMAKREQKWRGVEARLKSRVDELESEREVMAKTLLKLWGREECGVVPGQEDEGQKYRYAFVKKEGLEKSRSVKFGTV